MLPRRTMTLRALPSTNLQLGDETPSSFCLILAQFANSITAAATRRAAATSTLSVAATAPAAPPRTRPSSASPSATWSSLLLFVCLSYASPRRILANPKRPANMDTQVTSPMPRSLPSTPCPRCTLSCSTASLVPFTARLSGTLSSPGV